MREIITENLIDAGYTGRVNSGHSRKGEIISNEFLHITIPKKGNSKLIKTLLSYGWEKEREYKNGSYPQYAGYSMLIDMKIYYS